MQTGNPQDESNAPAQTALGFMRNPTPWLREFVAAQATALPPEEFARMLEAISRLYTSYSDVLRSATPGPARGLTLHRMLDQALATADGLPTSCRRGCAGCCHFEVEITSDEAALLAAKVRAGMPVDRKRLGLQAARPRMDPAWGRFLDPANRCVFLGDDQTCRIYDWRPAACRRLLVTTPPQACTTPGAAVAPVHVLIAEVLLSAALDLAGGTYASIARLLSKELDENPSPDRPGS